MANELELIQSFHVSAERAISCLVALENAAEAALSETELRAKERIAYAIKALYESTDPVRMRAEITILKINHKIGTEERRFSSDPNAALRLAKGSQGTLLGKEKGGAPKFISGGVRRTPPDTTMAQRHGGSKMRGRILRKLSSKTWPEVRRIADKLHRERLNATVSAVIKIIVGDETKARRAASRAAIPLDDLDYRIGDCRIVLADIPDNSVPLILTDPPYGDEAQPLYEWLSQWAKRVLIPGGSLVCYTGQSRLNRDIHIFDQCLRYWWLMIMKHDQSQRLPGKFVIANFKPVLWYVKEFRRGRTLVPDVLVSPSRDKESHSWGQGDGGIQPIIEHLTEPEELIVDPFAGTGRWGKISTNMGRRWIGADISHGGSEEVRA